MSDNLMGVATAVNVSRSTLKNIHQNLFGLSPITWRSYRSQQACYIQVLACFYHLYSQQAQWPAQAYLW